MSKKVLGATALALLIGASAFSLNTAAAQNGGEARSNDRANQKKLDARDLTPIRPIRRVGEDGWPAAKDQPTVRETSGQSAKQDEKKEEPAKQDTAKQEPTKQEPAKQEPAKQDTAKQDAAKPEQKQDTAKKDTPKPDAKSDVKPQDTAQTKAPEKTDGKKNDKGFASIRLGTDESGRVAVNEAQERQIAKAMHKQRVESVNVKVAVGSVAPANVRLVAVSSDLVEILPQFRGDSLFATGDEIVIVEPSTRKVIALVPAKLTATAARAPDERTARTEKTETRAPAPKPAAKPPARTAERLPTREEILAAPAARGPAGTTVTRTYRSYQYEPYDDDDDVVVIERRRPRFFGFW